MEPSYLCDNLLFRFGRPHATLPTSVADDFSHLMPHPINFSMPPIIHQRLKTLKLRLSPRWDVAPRPLGSLTLPYLQEVMIYDAISLKQLPALVRRSSCPLTSLILSLDSAHLPFDELRPSSLPGMTDLVIEGWRPDGGAMMRLLLEGYFPDLRHLTLRLQPFEMLWDIGIIPLLLDRKRPQLDDRNEGRLDKFIVVDQDWDCMWNSGVREKLKELNITMREDGFEFF